VGLNVAIENLVRGGFKPGVKAGRHLIT
jgi:hypothetical protein